MIDFSMMPKKITLKNTSFFEIMSMVQQCQYYGYELSDWDIKYGTFLGFITQIHYTIVMEMKKGDTMSGVPLDVLLESAIYNENYEEAARLRDLLNRK